MLNNLRLRINRIGFVAALALMPAINVNCTKKQNIAIVSSPDLAIQKQESIRNLVAELNGIIPQRPVTKVKIHPCYGHYNPETQEITVPVKTDDYLDPVAHEMGHAIYETRLKNTLFGDFWGQIYQVSLGWKNYQLLKDDSYISPASLTIIHEQCNMQWGHGTNEPSELFASALTIYRRHSDQYLARLYLPGLPEKSRRFGKLVFLFMRDYVFDGRYFSGVDPFAGERFFDHVGRDLNGLEIDALSSICQDDQLPLLKYGLDSYALIHIFRSHIRDERFFTALERHFQYCPNSRDYIFQLAAEAGLEDLRMDPIPGNERFLLLVIKGLADQNARYRAMEAIVALKLRDSKLLEPLVKILAEEKNDATTAIEALAVIGDKRAFPYLEKLINRPDEIGQAAKKAILSLKANQ
ncbi:MAG: hypothetical protein WCW67_02790 [Candidatus Margulisiibacteriota bacterium]|jgi:hypothetical protein